MARTSTRNRLIPSLFLAIMLSLLPVQVQARGGVDVPPLDVFIEQVRNGEADVLRGVYVPGVLASPILPQPEGSPAFVSSIENTLTQFSLASQYGSTGLLAHNFLAGEDFVLIEPGQVFHLIYGDGRTEAFIVTGQVRVRALDPNNVRSNFIDLDTGSLLTAPKLFYRIYDQPGHVIFQTCIQALGDPSWGRLFIIAEPYIAGELQEGEPALLE